MADQSSLKCRVCGCTENDCSQCVRTIGRPCGWVEPGLCSACLGHLVEFASRGLLTKPEPADAAALYRGFVAAGYLVRTRSNEPGFYALTTIGHVLLEELADGPIEKEAGYGG